MRLNLTVDEVLSTTRSVRRRLDVSKPVPRAEIEECLELALQAPNGSNANTWRWVVVDEPAKVAGIGGIYRAVATELLSGVQYQATDSPELKRILDSSMTLLNKIERMPAIVIPLMVGRPEGKDVAGQAAMWGSLLPAVWSFFLALRERGLGSVWTTAALRREREIAAILEIPYDKYAQAGMFPVAYTVGTDFKKAYRKPLSEVLSFNVFRSM